MQLTSDGLPFYVKSVRDAFKGEVDCAQLVKVYGEPRPHKSLCEPHGPRVTPAMAAGLTDHVWTIDELIGLLSAAETTPIKRGTYRKTRERKAVARGESVSD